MMKIGEFFEKHYYLDLAPGIDKSKMLLLNIDYLCRDNFHCASIYIHQGTDTHALIDTMVYGVSYQVQEIRPDTDRRVSLRIDQLMLLNLAVKLLDFKN